MDVRIAGPTGCRFEVKLDALTPPHVLYRHLAKLLQVIPTSLVLVTRVRLQVEFEANRDGGLLDPRTFDLRIPNACTLQYDAAGNFIRCMLEDHGIEPRQPAHEKEDAGSLL